MSTTARVLIGLALGVLVGSLSTLVGDDFAARLAGIVSPVGTLWLNALRMTVVPLVVSLVIVGVADATSVASAGRITTLALGVFVVLTTLGFPAARSIRAPCRTRTKALFRISRDSVIRLPVCSRPTRSRRPRPERWYRLCSAPLSWDSP